MVRRSEKLMEKWDGPKAAAELLLQKFGH